MVSNPLARFESVGVQYLPINTLVPTVTGIGYVGYTLTVSDGSWTGYPSPTITYQWQRNGVDIVGATASTYVVTLADEGVPVRCVVIATNIAGVTRVNSNAIEQWVPTDAGTVDGRWGFPRIPSQFLDIMGIPEEQRNAWISTFAPEIVDHPDILQLEEPFD